MNATIVEYIYIASAALFVLSLRWMGEVRTSRRGNWAGMGGMALAIAGTLLAFQIQRADLLLLAFAVGSLVGIPIALRVPMTAVPQRTAMSHAFGSLAVALIGVAEYFERLPDVDVFTMSVLATEMILGFLTFTGSCLAFAKLQELIPGKAFVYPGRNFVTLATLGSAVALGLYLIVDPSQTWVLSIMALLAMVFGLLLVMGVGGADMPTVIAILNSYAGLSAAALGFVLNNKILIVAGTLDGASGFVLAVVMCKAMNRSFINVLFGGLGATVTSAVAQPTRQVQAYGVEDVVTMLDNAQSVIVIPGYGLAVSRAQHVVKELEDILESRGIDVKYAIHPVAGRMPGHMNVLLAEAEVDYGRLWEMERINPLFPEADVAIVVGANDVVNPAAKTQIDSPLYGMPVLDVDRARSVVIIKRSMASGYAGVDNELFYLPKTMMVFGDAKNVLAEMTAALKSKLH